MTPELTAALDALLAWHTDPHRQILAPPVDAVIAAWDKETEVDEMSEKTLGQVAYEALVVGYGEKVDAKEWPGLSQATHDAWQVAAEAVELALGPQPVVDDLDARIPVAIAERAVIEAAELVAYRPMSDWDALAKLKTAVAALRAAKERE